MLIVSWRLIVWVLVAVGGQEACIWMDWAVVVLQRPRRLIAQGYDDE